jgi:hydroxymethylpyrimidine/phosphomethylpyrimidine kinase
MNHHTPSSPVVLTIAGFDPSGGAGIIADLKTFAAHNCYGAAAITALTIQNTQGVSAIHAMESTLLKDTIRSVLADGRTRAVKIGMLAHRANCEAVSEILDANNALPSVLDPVLRSSSGMDMLDMAGLNFLRDHLLRRVTVITPNLAEAEALTGLKVQSLEGMKAAAHKLVEMGARAVVVTGGHLDKPIDIFHDGKQAQAFTGDRVKPDNTHGTGCTFSSAIAANLAQGRNLADAVVLAKAYVTEAIRKAFEVGPGRVPLNHLYRLAQPARLLDHASAAPEPVQ